MSTFNSETMRLDSMLNTGSLLMWTISVHPAASYATKNAAAVRHGLQVRRKILEVR